MASESRWCLCIKPKVIFEIIYKCTSVKRIGNWVTFTISIYICTGGCIYTQSIYLFFFSKNQQTPMACMEKRRIGVTREKKRGKKEKVSVHTPVVLRTEGSKLRRDEARYLLV